MKNFGYYGFSKEDYDSCKYIRDSSNQRNIIIISTIFGSLELFFGIMSCFTLSTNKYSYLNFYGIATLYIIILIHKFFNKTKTEIIVYILMSLVCSFGITMSIPSKDEKAILFLVLIVLLPVLFVDNAWRMISYIILVCIIYLIIAFKVKLANIAQTDLFNIIGFGGLSIITQYFVNKKIVDGFICRAQNEKLLKAYEKAQCELKQQAQTDLMTGLYNRTHFVDQLAYFIESSISNGDTIYLVMLDLDKFKKINDILGHQEGDKIIINVAEIIKAHLKEEEFATRLGGDEYMFILAQRFHNINLDNVVDSISHEIHAIQVAPEWYASGSIGVTRINTADYSFENLYRITDNMLYKAKNLGGNHIVYSDAKVG